MRMFRREALGILCFLMIASSVYADEGSSSQPIGLNNRHAARSEKDFNVKIDGSLQKENAPVVPVSFPGMNMVDWGAAGKRVSSVAITGEKVVPVGMLHSSLSAKPGNVLTKADILNDMQAIYLSGFFSDVRFLYHVVPEDGSIQVMYVVKENPVLKDIVVHGTKLFNSKQLSVSLGNPEGQVLNIRTVGEKLSEVTDIIRKNGYALFTMTGIQFTEDGVLHVSFSDGIVDGFEVRGSKRTKPVVVTREIRQKVGEPLNTDLLQYSAMRLNNLGLFDLIDFQLEASETNPGHVRVVVLVEEGNNAVVGVGVGYGEIDGVVGQFTIGDKNFLGRGHDVQLRYEIGGETKRNYDFSYYVPYIDKKGTGFRINLYDGIHETADYDHWGDEMARYRKRALGQEITISRADTDVTRNSITFKNRKDGYDGPVNGYERQFFEDSYNYEFYKRYGYVTTAEERRKKNFGTTRSVTLSRVYDNRDSADFPTRGKRNEISFEFAGFGGDFNYQKITYDQRYYWPAGAKGKHTLAAAFGIGYAWGNLPLSQRFSMGGPTTLRGYENGQFRGNSMLRGSLEYRIPLSKKAAVLAFVDSGYAWDSDLEKERNFDLKKLKYGFGIGIRVKTPVGPVRLDYGMGRRDSGQHYRGRFHFSFGGNF